MSGLFPNASVEAANVVLFLIFATVFQYLPRLLAAMQEDDTDDFALPQ